LVVRCLPRSTLFPYTTLFRSRMKSNRRNFLKVSGLAGIGLAGGAGIISGQAATPNVEEPWKRSPIQGGKHFNMSGYAAPKIETVDRKSTRLNSSHVKISYAVF